MRDTVYNLNLLHTSWPLHVSCRKHMATLWCFKKKYYYVHTLLMPDILSVSASIS